jgi:hypothetical protein
MVYYDNRVIRKVRKRQNQYPEFGHKQGEIFKKPAKEYIRTKDRMKTQEIQN